MVGDPGELIAGIPAMIGFPPQRSLVVLILRPVHEGTSVLVDAVMRIDLDQDEGRTPLRATTVARCVSQVAVHADRVTVLAVVVDDRVTEPRMPAGDIGESCRAGRFERLVADLAERLTTADIELAAAWAVQAIEPEQPWSTLVGPARAGVLPDPADSAIADGAKVVGSRAELEAAVRADVELQQEVSVLLDAALAAGRDRQARAAQRDDPSSYCRRSLEYVLLQVASIEAGGQLMAPELAELAVALRDRAVRDVMFALAVGEHAAAAETLWSIMARAQSGRDRAEAAALLAYSAYVRGDGPVAGIALEAALGTDPEHPLATLLETALSIGMRPEKMTRLAHSGFEAATDLGVDLGEPSPSIPHGSADLESHDGR
ncbi:hypothetical protein AW168_35285 [Nocardia brasiliensis]|uniref:DUF4192 domain-containing protein n=1 Tax=Nocardia brasiliensis (strain ATCC 700358 / HUJEG-1) TaxID=1133849 RepID=K0EZ79_NOCB7|nr:hypothetical protein O3I_024160 [Nocardia brasiliensis ATCC 700358]OCF85526.1 hypothetical protein AW168_35285 [Nocardia brasiliensis]